MQNPALVFLKPPVGEPVPGQDIAVLDRPMPDTTNLPPNHLGLQTIYSSLDPYLRNRMREQNRQSYAAALAPNTAIVNFSVARVLRSANPGFAVDDLVYGILPIQRFSIVDPAKIGAFKKLDPQVTREIPLVNMLGALGMPGLTAYSSLFEIGRPQRGEVLFVSSAAGAVGQIVIQLAKHLGLYVIGSVGNDDKLGYILEELGCDAGFNYKVESVYDAIPRLLAKADKQGLDIYYDNVGGEQLDCALQNMNAYGRIVACGAISDYNAKSVEQRFPQRNLMNVVGKQLTIRGFIVSGRDMGPKWEGERDKVVAEWLRDGSLVTKYHEDDISVADKAFVGMLRGENFGKAVLKVS